VVEEEGEEVDDDGVSSRGNPDVVTIRKTRIIIDLSILSDRSLPLLQDVG